MSNAPVYFVAYELRRRWPELVEPDSYIDVATVPVTRLHLIENIWIVSTYLQLKMRGRNVRIVDRLVPDHINVCTSEQLLTDANARGAFIVVADADRRDLIWGDFHIVQSPAMLRDHHSHLIDHWPQPGLRPRNPSRGDRIKRIAYFGYPGNLARRFREASFDHELAKLGVEFVLRERPDEWHDYHDLDLCLAVRDLTNYWVATKPLTKLAQAWLTECPALLGPEPSYQHWGKPGVDYFEVVSPRDALVTIRRLKDEPHLYRRAIKEGRSKAAAHDEEAVAAQWMAGLDGPIQEAFKAWQDRRAADSFGRRLRFAATRAVEPMQRRLFRLRAEGLKAVRRRLGSR